MQEKIFTICDTLSKAGIKPTAEKVREELGSGSFSTISPIIKQWRDMQSKVELSPEMPPEATKAVNQATAIIWKIATEHQTEAINAIRQECNRIEQEALAERDEALNEIRFLEEQVKNLRSHIERLEEKNTVAISEKNTLDLQIQKQQLIIENSNSTNEQLKIEIGEFKNSLEKTKDIANKEKNKLELELEKQKITIASFTKDNENLKVQYTELQNKIESERLQIESEKRSLELQIHKQQISLDSCNKDNTELKAEIKEVRKVATTAQNEASKLEGMLETLKKPPAAKKTAVKTKEATQNNPEK